MGGSLIPIVVIGMGMVADVGYHMGDSGIRHVVCQYPTVVGGWLNMYFAAP
jgi:hypothetical protein